MVEIGASEVRREEESTGHDLDLNRGVVHFYSFFERLLEVFVGTNAFEGPCLGAEVLVEHVLLENGDTAVISDGVGFQAFFDISNEMGEEVGHVEVGSGVVKEVYKMLGVVAVVVTHGGVLEREMHTLDGRKVDWSGRHVWI